LRFGVSRASWIAPDDFTCSNGQMVLSMPVNVYAFIKYHCTVRARAQFNYRHSPKSELVCPRTRESSLSPSLLRGTLYVHARIHASTYMLSLPPPPPRQKSTFRFSRRLSRSPSFCPITVLPILADTFAIIITRRGRFIAASPNLPLPIVALERRKKDK